MSKWWHGFFPHCILWQFLLWARVHAQTGEVRPEPWVRDPVARHTACSVANNAPTVCRLFGGKDFVSPLEFRIKTLPKEGLLYETSGNWRMWGTDPKHLPDPIGPHLLPFLVTDPEHRIVYVPPFNRWPPAGAWASFTYTVQYQATDASPPATSATPGTTVVRPISEPGLMVLSNPDGSIAATDFDLASHGDGWTISGNLADADALDGGLKHHAFAWGGLNQYIYGTDEVQILDFGSGTDRSKWYFEAPKDPFQGILLSSGYGGTFRFTTRSLYGNFDELNAPLDWVTIECASCNSGQGARIVRFVDDRIMWGGSERAVEFRLLPVGGWMRDPLNSALDFTFATACDIAAVLSNVSRVAILGDFTRAGEGIAIDNVAIIQAPQAEQPSFPLHCQRGCTCKHNPGIKRITCC